MVLLDHGVCKTQVERLAFARSRRSPPSIANYFAQSALNQPTVVPWSLASAEHNKGRLR